MKPDTFPNAITDQVTTIKYLYFSFRTRKKFSVNINLYRFIASIVLGIVCTVNHRLFFISFQFKKINQIIDAR